MGHRFLDHTADTGVEVWAPDREGLFAEALRAFTDTITDVTTVEPAVARELAVAADSLPDLMVEWLEELLYRFETEGLLFCRAQAAVGEEAGRFALTARAEGEEYDADRHPLKILVKAVTYHNLEVGEVGRRDDGSWRARVIFDI